MTNSDGRDAGAAGCHGQQPDQRDPIGRPPLPDDEVELTGRNLAAGLPPRQRITAIEPLVDLARNRLLTRVSGRIAGEEPGGVEWRKSPRRYCMLLPQKITQHTGEVRYATTVGCSGTNQQNPHATSSVVAAGATAASAASIIDTIPVAMPPGGFV